jgi:hypothetical protein
MPHVHAAPQLYMLAIHVVARRLVQHWQRFTDTLRARAALESAALLSVVPGCKVVGAWDALPHDLLLQQVAHCCCV